MPLAGDVGHREGQIPGPVHQEEGVVQVAADLAGRLVGRGDLPAGQGGEPPRHQRTLDPPADRHLVGDPSSGEASAAAPRGDVRDGGGDEPPPGSAGRGIERAFDHHSPRASPSTTIRRITRAPFRLARGDRARHPQRHGRRSTPPDHLAAAARSAASASGSIRPGWTSPSGPPASADRVPFRQGGGGCGRERARSIGVDREERRHPAALEDAAHRGSGRREVDRRLARVVRLAADVVDRLPAVLGTDRLVTAREERDRVDRH
jgi:hypothetical protein